MITICVVDPSGNFNSGKGKTGISYIQFDEVNNILDWKSLQFYTISAKNYPTRHEYWENIIKKTLNANHVIIESFMIRTEGFLVGTMPETIMLIGVLTWELEKLKMSYIFQTPSQAKVRFKDPVLLMKVPGLEFVKNRYYLNGKITNDHVRDSLKHLLYYTHYGRKKT